MNLASFIFKSETLDGYPVIVAGICPFYFITEAKEELNNAIKNFRLDRVNDGLELDYSLAQYICPKAPEHILALGVTISVPGIKGPAGGIIGNPRKIISSADGFSEYIGNNLSLAAYPGGPGVVIEGNPEEAARILDLAQAGTGDIKTLLQMAMKIIDLSIPNGIIVSDGSDVNGKGCAAAINGNKIEFYVLT
ncbi:hypothetical protein [Thermoanaerobacterium sp. DL9XJH110]|uniref:hypothetical protein n=1 Tax=Thermoanaerobacterium sp. DL9XJH110 TaxID=3386643 RepID=UPI003BB77A84